MLPLTAILCALLQSGTELPAIRCEFLLPAEGEIVSGPTKLKVFAASNTAAALDRVEFWVDGELAGSDRRPPYEWLVDFGPTTAEHLLMVKAIDATGRIQHAYRRTRGLSLQMHQQVLLVELDLTVLDRNGRRVGDIEPEDLQVFEDGARQRIDSFALEPRPLRLALVLDSSASMQRKLWRAQEAAIQFLGALAPDDRAAVIDFDDRIRVAAVLSGDREALVRGVKSARADGKTHLFDALGAGVELVAGAPESRRAVILLTDGRDEGSAETFAGVVEQARRSGAACYAIGLRDSGADLSGGAEPLFIPREEYLLRWLADATGGAAFFPDHVGQLEGIYRQILEELRAQYRLSYYSSDPRRDGRWRAVEIRMAHPSLQVRSRPGYYAKPNGDRS
ncbi:MAG TPA: VWA domain-containing protein [Acidobacteriota bacterium]